MQILYPQFYINSRHLFCMFSYCFKWSIQIYHNQKKMCKNYALISLINGHVMRRIKRIEVLGQILRGRQVAISSFICVWSFFEYLGLACFVVSEFHADVKWYCFCYRQRYTLKILKIWTPKNIAVIILQFAVLLCGYTHMFRWKSHDSVNYCKDKMRFQ